MKTATPDAERVKSLIAEAQAANAAFETYTLAYVVKKHFDRLSGEFFKSPEDLELLQKFSRSAALLPLLPFERQFMEGAKHL